jgi:GMP synthase-like glutamine amidotransferase
MEILVLEHEREAPAGLLADWAHERGHTLRVLDVPQLDRWPALAGGDAVVSLGSEHSVRRSREPWIASELRYLRAAHEARVPVLGICFGAQALAAALGGAVERAERIAVEWSEPDWREEELIPGGPWLRWHEDVFTVPPGAREIASARGVPMGFLAGRSVAVQFHPEADARIAAGWIASSGRTLVGRGADLARVERALELDADDARRRALELFDRVADCWSQD